MFQFPGFALPHGSTWSSTKWVAPFRHARIKTCLQFPEPFRSLPRLSSPPDSLGILRSLFVPFSDFVPTFCRLPRWTCPPVLTTTRLLRSSTFAFLDLEKNASQILLIYQTNSIFCFTSNLFSQYCQRSFTLCGCVHRII